MSEQRETRTKTPRDTRSLRTSRGMASKPSPQPDGRVLCHFNDILCSVCLTFFLVLGVVCLTIWYALGNL